MLYETVPVMFAGHSNDPPKNVPDSQIDMWYVTWCHFHVPRIGNYELGLQDPILPYPTPAAPLVAAGPRVQMLHDPWMLQSAVGASIAVACRLAV